MWYQLYSSQFHFAVHLFGALVFFASGWLYLDAYSKTHSYLRLRIAGLFLLAISSLLEGVQIQLASGAQDYVHMSWPAIAQLAIPIIGYLCIFLSFPFDPIQERPAYAAVGMFTIPLRNAILTLLPVGPISVAIMYFIHVSEGLEWHLLLPSISFFLIGISGIFHVIQIIFSSTQSIYISDLVAVFGMFWWIEHIALLVGFIFLMRWIFWYLLKSFEMQLVFIAALGVSVLTFVITAFFTYHLFSSLLTEISRQVTQSVKVFSFSIDSKKREALADARFIAVDARLITAVKDSKENDVRIILQEYAMSRGIRGLLFVNAKGEPVIRNDSDNIFTDMKPFTPVITKVKEGVESSMMIAVPGIASPMLYMLASVPVRSGSVLTGAILLAYSLDSAVTQGIKNELGLEGALFAGDRLSVTSMRGGESLVGMKETNPQILKKVLVEGLSYEGTVLYNTTEYLGAYVPITNSTDTPIGMMYVGRATGEIFSLLSQAISGTYIVSTILLVLSILPALYVAKYIIYQVH